MGKRRGSHVAVSATIIAALATGCGTFLDFGGGGEDPPPLADGGSDSSVRLDGAAPDRGPGEEADGALLPPEDAAVDPDAAIPIPVAGCPGDAGCERVVFLTKDPVPFAQLVASDTFCTTLAASATAHPRVKNRPFQAWTSTAGGPAMMRFVHGALAYVRPDAVVVASKWSDLTDGTIAVAIFRDQEGNAVNGVNDVWTGTTANGSSSGKNCDGWLNPNATSDVGRVSGAGSNWSLFSPAIAPCSSTNLRLYCFEK